MSAASSSSDSSTECLRNVKIGGYNSSGLSPNVGITVKDGKIVDYDPSGLFNALPVNSSTNLTQVTDSHGKPTQDIKDSVKAAINAVMQAHLQKVLDAIKEQGQNVPDGDYKCYPSEMDFEATNNGDSTTIQRTDNNDGNTTLQRVTEPTGEDNSPQFFNYGGNNLV